jgi:hypothetical protein
VAARNVVPLFVPVSVPRDQPVAIAVTATAAPRETASAAPILFRCTIQS